MNNHLKALLSTLLLTVTLALPEAHAVNPCNPCGATKVMNPCNPCAAKKGMNPCNPCAAKKGMNPCNPCAGKKGMNPCNPCASKKGMNPCAPKNPCGISKDDLSKVKRPAGTKLASGNRTGLLKLGAKLWNDPGLGTSGLTCNACHANNASFTPSFEEPYPHRVEMAVNRYGMDTIHLDEMVQICVVIPLAGDPLPWESKELAALTAYTEEKQKEFMHAANPCAAKKGMNPCNPCAAK